MSIQVIVDSEAKRTVLVIEDADMPALMKSLCRATNTWQDMPVVIQDLKDVLFKHAAAHPRTQGE